MSFRLFSHNSRWWWHSHNISLNSKVINIWRHFSSAAYSFDNRSYKLNQKRQREVLVNPQINSSWLCNKLQQVMINNGLFVCIFSAFMFRSVRIEKNLAFLYCRSGKCFVTECKMTFILFLSNGGMLMLWTKVWASEKLKTQCERGSDIFGTIICPHWVSFNFPSF